MNVSSPSFRPIPIRRDESALSLVIGEVHHAKKPGPVERPRWLTIPERGLYTGIAVFGAIGSGKTSGCMYPFAEQILAYRARRARAADRRARSGSQRRLLPQGARDPREARARRRLRRSQPRLGRTGTTRCTTTSTPTRWPTASPRLLNNLFGKGKEPFWQQAYTNLVKFVILLHKVLDDYVTLFDVYQGAINPDYLEQKIKEGEARSGAGIGWRSTFDDFIAVQRARRVPVRAGRRLGPDEGAVCGRSAPAAGRSQGRVSTRSRSGRACGGGAAPGPKRSGSSSKPSSAGSTRTGCGSTPKLRTSIVEGISVFLSLFDDNPAVKRVFCPPKETYDPVANADGRYGRPLPPFAELIEQGAVCALNFPVSANPGLARTIGTLMKQDFQRAVLEPHSARWNAEPDASLAGSRSSSATSTTPSPPSARATRRGDEKFFALSRQAKCIPIVATQSISSLRSTLPGESWRTLLQTFRTKIFLALSDDFSARTASELCGKEEQLKPNYSFSEHGQDAGVSIAHRPSRRASRDDRHDQGLQRPARLRLRAEDVLGTQERPGDRAGLRRLEPAAADLLLPETVLPRLRTPATSSSSRRERSDHELGRHPPVPAADRAAPAGPGGVATSW